MSTPSRSQSSYRQLDVTSGACTVIVLTRLGVSYPTIAHWCLRLHGSSFFRFSSHVQPPPKRLHMRIGIGYVAEDGIADRRRHEIADARVGISDGREAYQAVVH